MASVASELITDNSRPGNTQGFFYCLVWFSFWELMGVSLMAVSDGSYKVSMHARIRHSLNSPVFRRLPLCTLPPVHTIYFLIIKCSVPETKIM